MKKYMLTGMSRNALDNLSSVLDEMGFSDQYKIDMAWETLEFKLATEYGKVMSAIRESENRAHGEKGWHIQVQQVSYGDVWISASEAKNLDDAKEKAISLVDSGELRVMNAPETYVAEVGDTLELF